MYYIPCERKKSFFLSQDFLPPHQYIPFTNRGQSLAETGGVAVI